MGHEAKPWYRKSKDAWYVQVDGKQVRLAKGEANRKAAMIAFHKLMAAGGPARTSARGGVLRVGDVCNLYVAHATENLAPLTAEFYKRHLDKFAVHAGAVPVPEAAPRLVTAWLAKKPKWGPSTRAQAITAIKRAFRWAKREGHIPADPFADLDKPAMRARQAILTREQADAIRASVPPGDPFGDFLDVLADTGCRPSEAMAIEARHLDTRARTVTMEGKTSRRTGRKRTIHLTPAVADRLSQLARIYPTGPLLRANPPKGKDEAPPWTRNATACRFRRLREKLGMGPEATAESYRHLFITDALESGVPIATVSELAGHTTTIMVSRHYSKLSERHDHLKDALARVRGDQVPSPQNSGPQIARGAEAERGRGGGSDGNSSPESEPAGT